MKKLFIFLALTLSCELALHSEPLVATYHMSSFDYYGNTYRIEATKPINGKYTCFIQVAGVRERDKVYMCIEGENIPTFISTLQQIKEKYVEWYTIAKENNVTDLKKEFPYKFYDICFFWEGSQWWKSANRTITPRFIVLSSGGAGVAIYEKVHAYTNQYIEQKAYLILDSEEEFDTLINALNPQHVYDYYNKQDSKQDLFN